MQHNNPQIALISDTHWGCKNDSTIFLKHFEEFYSQIFFPELRARGIKRIIHYGDLLDRRKFVNYVSSKKMKNSFFDVALSEGITIDLIPGNHDVYYKNTNEVNGPQELLEGYPNVTIHMEPQKIGLGNDVNALLVPWINNSNYNAFMEKIKEADVPLVIGHFEFKGFEMYKGMQNEDGMGTEIFRRFRKVISGHYHHKSDDGVIFYTGAPYQMNWADHGDQRGFHILHVNAGLDLEFIENPLKMFHKVYYNDEEVDYSNEDVEQYRNRYVQVIVLKKSKPAIYEDYIDRLFRVDPEDLKVVEDMSYFHESQVEDEKLAGLSAAEIIDVYIDELPNNDISIDKSEIKKILRTLYLEANYAE